MIDRLPAYRKLLALQKEEEEEERRLGKEPHYYAKNNGQMPAQGLRYYPDNKEVVDELIEQMRQDLEDFRDAHPGEPFPAQLLHRCFTSANMQIKVAIALPSSDGKFHQSEKKSVSVNDYPQSNGLLTPPPSPIAGNPAILSRSPFNGQALITIEEADVRTPESAHDSLTARYLSKTHTLQIRGLTQTRQIMPEGAMEIDSLSSPEDWFYSFHKGLLTVVEDKDWPTDFQDVDVAMPSGDRKTHTKALGEKKEPTEVTRADMAMLMTASEIYPANSQVAVPPKVWKEELGGDHDGDPALFMNLIRQILNLNGVPVDKNPGEEVATHPVKEMPSPKLFAFLKEQDARRRQKGIISLKPPKQLTSGFHQYEGLNVPTADKLSVWLKTPGEEKKALFEEIVAELRKQCVEMAAKHRENPACHLLVLRTKFYQWRDAKNNVGGIQDDMGADRLREYLRNDIASLLETVLRQDNVTPNKSISLGLRAQINDWLNAPHADGVSIICNALQQEYDQTAGLNQSAMIFSKLLDLDNDVRRWTTADNVDERQQTLSEIEQQFENTPQGGEIYTFGRAKNFMPTRLGLMQSFATLQDIYYFIPSKKRAAVAKEIVKQFYEGMAEDTVTDINALLLDKLDESETQTIFDSVLASLDVQANDPQKSPEIREQLGRLKETLGTWWESKQMALATTVDDDASELGSAPMSLDSDPALRGTDPTDGVEEERRNNVWDLLNEIPTQQFAIPENWPKKPIDDSASEDAYYEDIAELWLRLGSYIGTDIFKMGGEAAKRWHTASFEASMLFGRLQKAGTYGVNMQVPYRKWNVVDIVKYGIDPDQFLRSLGECDNLEAAIQRAVTAFFKDNYPEVFLGTERGSARSHQPIAEIVTVDEALRARQPDMDWDGLVVSIEQKNFLYVTPVVPWLIKVIQLELAGQRGRDYYVQLDKTGKIIRCEEVPEQSEERDELYGRTEFPNRLKKWERDPAGVVIENPRRQILKEGKKLHFSDEDLQAIAKGELWLKWIINAEGDLVVGVEVPGMDADGKDCPKHQRKLLGHPNLTDGLPARIGGKIRVVHSGGQFKLVIDNHSTRYSTHHSRKEKHLDNAIELFNKKGLLELNWQAAIGETPTVEKHWYSVHESGKRFIEGTDEEEKIAQDKSDDPQITSWEDFKLKLESSPPDTTFKHVAAFIAQQARYWERKETNEKQPAGDWLSVDWATTLKERLPALRLDTPTETLRDADIGRWLHVFTLLSAAKAPEQVGNVVLQQTTQLLRDNNDKLTAWTVASLAQQLHRFENKADISAHLNTLRSKIADWLREGLAEIGFNDNADDTVLTGFREAIEKKPSLLQKRLLTPQQISMVVNSLMGEPSTPTHERMLKVATLHAKAQRLRLNASENREIVNGNDCLLDDRSIRNILQGVRTVSAADVLPPLLKELQAHLDDPRHPGFEDLDESDRQRLLAEVLDSIGPHMHLPSAQTLVSALYEKTGEPMALLSTLKQQRGRENEIYRLLKAAGHVTMDTEAPSMTIDLHGCSHHLGETLTRLALCDVLAPDRLHITYGDATHRPINQGKMPDAAKAGIQAAGFDTTDIRFPHSQLILDKSKLQRIGLPFAAAAIPTQVATPSNVAPPSVPRPRVAARPEKRPPPTRSNSQEPPKKRTTLAGGGEELPMPPLPLIANQQTLTEDLSEWGATLPDWKVVTHLDATTGEEIREVTLDEKTIRGFNDCAPNAVVVTDDELQKALANRADSREVWKASLLTLWQQAIATIHPDYKLPNEASLFGEEEITLSHAGWGIVHTARLLNFRGYGIEIIPLGQSKASLKQHLNKIHQEGKRLVLNTGSKVTIGPHSVDQGHVVSFVPTTSGWVLCDPNPHHDPKAQATIDEMRIPVTMDAVVDALDGGYHYMLAQSAQREREMLPLPSGDVRTFITNYYIEKPGATLSAQAPSQKNQPLWETEKSEHATDIDVEMAREYREIGIANNQPAAFIDRMIYALHDLVETARTSPVTGLESDVVVSADKSTLNILYEALGLNPGEARMSDFRRRVIDLHKDEKLKQPLPDYFTDAARMNRWVNRIKLTAEEWHELASVLLGLSKRFNLIERNFAPLAPVLSASHATFDTWSKQMVNLLRKQNHTNQQLTSIWQQLPGKPPYRWAKDGKTYNLAPIGKIEDTTPNSPLHNCVVFREDSTKGDKKIRLVLATAKQLHGTDIDPNKIPSIPIDNRPFQIPQSAYQQLTTAITNSYSFPPISHQEEAKNRRNVSPESLPQLWEIAETTHATSDAESQEIDSERTLREFNLWGNYPSALIQTFMVELHDHVATVRTSPQHGLESRFITDKDNGLSCRNFLSVFKIKSLLELGKCLADLYKKPNTDGDFPTELQTAAGRQSLIGDLKLSLNEWKDVIRGLQDAPEREPRLNLKERNIAGLVPVETHYEQHSAFLYVLRELAKINSFDAPTADALIKSSGNHGVITHQGISNGIELLRKIKSDAQIDVKLTSTSPFPSNDVSTFIRDLRSVRKGTDFLLTCLPIAPYCALLHKNKDTNQLTMMGANGPEDFEQFLRRLSGGELTKLLSQVRISEINGLKLTKSPSKSTIIKTPKARHGEN